MAVQITTTGNTLLPAVLALESKGYCVSWKRSASRPEDELWLAEGPLGTFAADDPETVLGLVAMVEVRGEDWLATDSQIDDFTAKYQAD